MNTTFDYFETVPFNVCVCDTEGIVLYQNRRSREADGDVVGKSLFDCHNPHSSQMIKRMIETGTGFTNEVIHHGQRRMYHRTPWYNDANEVAGLIELGLILPMNVPVVNKDQ